MKKITAHFSPESIAHFKSDKGAQYHRILQFISLSHNVGTLLDFCFYLFFQ